jgi:hypothetical protein
MGAFPELLVVGLAIGYLWLIPLLWAGGLYLYRAASVPTPS